MRFAVLFDLEDTLVKTPWSNHQHVLKFRHETRANLIRLGIPAKVLEGIERSTLMRIKATAYVQANFDKSETERFHREMEKFLSRFELDSARKSRLFPETVTVLEHLKNLGVKIGLVTNTSSEAANIVFAVHGLAKYFDAVVTRDDVKSLKPDPESILLAKKKLGAENFIMVGDLDLDVSAAKSAEGFAVIVRREIGGHEGSEADCIIESLTEVPKIVQSRRDMAQCT